MCTWYKDNACAQLSTHIMQLGYRQAALNPSSGHHLCVFPCQPHLAPCTANMRGHNQNVQPAQKAVWARTLHLHRCTMHSQPSQQHRLGIQSSCTVTLMHAIRQLQCLLITSHPHAHFSCCMACTVRLGLVTSTSGLNREIS